MGRPKPRGKYSERLSNQEISGIFQALKTGLETGRLKIHLDEPVALSFQHEILFSLKLKEKEGKGTLEMVFEWDAP